MREALLKKFKTKIESGRPIIGGGAGTGLSAKCEERGGVDLIVIYNSGKYRMAGRGSLAGFLAYGNANEIVVEMASEVLPVVKSTPVLAGVNGTDPFLLVEPFLTKLKALGFSGIQNFPDKFILCKEKLYLRYFYKNWSCENFITENKALKVYLMHTQKKMLCLQGLSITDHYDKI